MQSGDTGSLTSSQGRPWSGGGGGIAVVRSSEGGGGATAGLGSIPLQPGELASEPFERPLSAPPPPGFDQGGSEERTRKASELIMRQVANRDDVARSGHNESSSDNDKEHSSSFSNLAAVLGSGLAQSMDDAAQDQAFSVDAMFNPHRDDLNFHRQSRHAASRLMAPSNTEREPYAAASGDVYRGFPSSLSSPQKREAMRVQMFPGQPSHLNAFPSKDIGTNIREPEGDNEFGKDVSRVVSQRIDLPGKQAHHPDPTMAELERGLGSLLSSAAREFKPQHGTIADGLISTASSVSDSAAGDNASDLTSRRAESELEPFTWSPDSSAVMSRTVVIMHVSYLRVPDVRSACDKFGLIESFRSDFASRGIYFVSYYDIRSAQYAVVELVSILQRQVVMQRSSEEVVVKFCIPLNSSSQFDESKILISELPQQVDQYVLQSILKSYGSIRSVVPQTSHIGAYTVEFNSLQDAKQAQLELESAQPFGPDTYVEVGMRTGAERRKGKELLAMLARWRQGLTRQIGSQQQFPDSRVFSSAASSSSDPWRNPTESYGNPNVRMSGQVDMSSGGVPFDMGAGVPFQQREGTATQFVLGPDGRYTPVVVQNQIPMSSFPPSGQVSGHQQQIVRGPNGDFYLASLPATAGHVYLGQDGGFPSTVIAGNIVTDGRRLAPTRTPYYTHIVSDAGSVSGLSGRSHRSAYSTGTETAEKDTRHLMLDLDAVENGRDTRTSLMVRNIPNKYTQQMLLSEFEENGHGPGVIDFFYLPIDFKNRCNRGYAFINFVDYRDILAFHQRYFGKHWRTFNSDKICDITYARIQGKTAMLKRFENSALMEKDDEYKPLVFVSDGPEKGKRLPFPDPSNKMN